MGLFLTLLPFIHNPSEVHKAKPSYDGTRGQQTEPCDTEEAVLERKWREENKRCTWHQVRERVAETCRIGQSALLWE